MGNPIPISVRKIRRELTWSVLIAIVIFTGATSWIVIPSIGTSLQAGISTYADQSGSYIFIRPVGITSNPALANGTLPQSVVASMRGIAGVEGVYPLVTFDTTINYASDPNDLIGRTSFSTIVGGSTGFPTSLVRLSAGSMPSNDTGMIGFLSNTPYLFANESTDAPARINQTFNILIGNYSFSATLTGRNTYVPLLEEIGILWPAQSLQRALGPTGYSKYVESSSVNYVIVKAQNAGDVPEVVASLNKILSNYYPYEPVYDESAISDYNSVKSFTAPLYQLLGLLSLLLTAIITAGVVMIDARRRSWETALLITQGWRWRDMIKFNFSYLLILSLIAYTFSLLVSILILSSLQFQYQVFLSGLTIGTSPDLNYVLGGLPITVFIVLLTSAYVSRQLRKKGIDSLLREH